MTAKYEAARALLTSEERDLYDAQRTRHGGIGIAKLQGQRCDGCHLDLSRAEVDQIRALPADELADCPQWWSRAGPLIIDVPVVHRHCRGDRVVGVPRPAVRLPLLAVGALLPDIIDLPGGQARWAHSLTVSVGLLVAVMLVTAGRKPIRRLLAGPADRHAPAPRLRRRILGDGGVSGWPFHRGVGATSRSFSSSNAAGGTSSSKFSRAIALWWIWRRCDCRTPSDVARCVHHGLLAQPAK
jgi:hypothetical protein